MYCVNVTKILTNCAAVAIILQVAHMMMVIAITEKGEKKMMGNEKERSNFGIGIYGIFVDKRFF